MVAMSTIGSIGAAQSRTTPARNYRRYPHSCRCRGCPLLASPENLHHKIPNQEVLGLGDELTVRPA